MRSVFLDTSSLFAFSCPRDQYFAKTQIIIKRLLSSSISIYTSDYVIDEAATLLLTSRKGSYRQSINLLDWFFETKNPIHLEWITTERFQKAKDVFKRFNKDKLWSFTDCTSYVVMKELKIKTVFTFDEHFKEMGFKLL